VAERLRAAMEAMPISARRLAKELAGRKNRPDRWEDELRAIRRYLKGERQPDAENGWLLEQILNQPSGSLTGPGHRLTVTALAALVRELETRLERVEGLAAADHERLAALEADQARRARG